VPAGVTRMQSLNRDLIAADEHEAAVVEPDGPPPGGIGDANATDLDRLADRSAVIIDNRSPAFTFRVGYTRTSVPTAMRDARS
jgi:hypothetical protein